MLDPAKVLKSALFRCNDMNRGIPQQRARKSTVLVGYSLIKISKRATSGMWLLTVRCSLCFLQADDPGRKNASEISFQFASVLPDHSSATDYYSDVALTCTWNETIIMPPELINVQVYNNVVVFTGWNTILVRPLFLPVPSLPFVIFLSSA